MDNEELQSLLNSSQTNQNQLKTKVTCPHLVFAFSVLVDTFELLMNPFVLHYSILTLFNTRWMIYKINIMSAWRC